NLGTQAKDLPLMARVLVASESKLSTAWLRHSTILRCGQVLVATERYRATHGKWPTTIAELVPDYVVRVPLSPFEGSPLQLRRIQHGVIVYSIGPYGKDSAGALDETNSLKGGNDLRLRLWDVAERRKQPKSRTGG